jgi:Acetyltransferase (GNAT) domain
VTSSSEYGWYVRPYQEGDIPGILELFREGGFPLRSEAQYRWKVLTVPATAPMIWLAVDGNRIVGHNSGTPIQLMLRGQPIAAIHENETITAPTHRRQGILTALAKECYRSWADGGYRLVVGLPWGTYGGRLQALGWTPLLSMVWTRRWVLPEQALARRARLPAMLRNAAIAVRPWSRLAPDPLRHPSRDTTIRELTAVESALDRLWKATANEWENGVVRDRAWLDWRYFQEPAFDYRMLLAERAEQARGYLVTRKERLADGATRGWIVDLFGPREEVQARRALLRQALLHFRQEGIELASALVARGSQLDDELLEAGFSHDDAGDFCVILLDPELSLDGLQRPAAWRLMGGDFDLV